MGAKPASGLGGVCEYPSVSHGKPVKSQLRTQSPSVIKPANISICEPVLAGCQRLKAAPASIGNRAMTAQKRAAARPASHHGMPPKTDMLTYTQETPQRKKPSPNASPVSSASRTEDARQRRANSTPHRSGGSQKASKGEKPSTPAEPARAASKRRGLGCSGSGVIRAGRGFGGIDQYRIEATAVCAQYLETQAFDLDNFVTLGNPSEFAQDQPAHRI